MGYSSKYIKKSNFCLDFMVLPTVFHCYMRQSRCFCINSLLLMLDFQHITTGNYMNLSSEKTIIKKIEKTRK